MKNISDTEAYTVFDHVFSKTVRSLSSVLGLKRVTQPFWSRWLASGVEEDAIFEFLDGVGTIDNWASTAENVVARKIAAFEAIRPKLSREEEVAALRRLSYLAHMAQWGCLPITDQRRALYRLTRDYYIEAESLAFGRLYHRLEIPWREALLFANLHCQPAAAPLIIIVHGIDGCKEEHLATELELYAAGFSTLCFDGPGQAEALLLSDILWEADFHRFISQAIDTAILFDGIDKTKIGVLGISIGGMWVLKATSEDHRIKAVFDLGGPIHTRKFPSLPFLIKTRLCQVTGARTPDEVSKILGQNNIESPALLAKITAHIRMLHGGRDRVVSTADKHWLRDQFEIAGLNREVSLRIIEDGDHCCTGHFDTVRADARDFFRRHFLQEEPRASLAP
jgi:alpha-beta hydrolase superfamily lysophospholipase